MEFISLKTERLTLKSIGSDDRDFMLSQFSDPSVNEFLFDAEPFTSIEDADELIGFYTEPQPRCQHRWILVLDNGTKIGTCGFHCWDKQNNVVEIGYDLKEKYRRQGYMNEALAAVLAFAKENMNLKSIDAHIYIGNIASIKLAEKMGFAYKGRDLTLNFHDHDYLHNIYTLTL